MLSKIACSSLQDWLQPSKPLLIVRYLGTTPDSSSLGPLLASICQQLSYTFMLPFEDIPDDIVPLTAHMKEILTRATEAQPLLIFLDSVDQLVGSQDANKMSWLPTKLPPFCKIVVSCTREEDNPLLCKEYEDLTKMVFDPNNFLEVKALGEDLAYEVIKLWMKKAGRDLNNYQWRVVANAVSRCSLPIFCKLVFAEICRWHSYSKPQETYLEHNVMDSIFLLYEKVEAKHGWLLVSHALAYVTAAKSGVSESEIEDLISLDDKVLDDIYQYHLPPSRRIPPLLWTRVRGDLPGYLTDSEADGVNVVNWYHRQFKDAAMQRYFKTFDDTFYFHNMIAEMFLGLWGGGNPKPFKFTEIQKHRFGLKSKDSTADRQIPAMPLVYFNKDGEINRYNLRKFGELPFHLIRCKSFELLYENVLFNYQWLYRKMCACPLQKVLEDFEDAFTHIEDPVARRQITLVADSLRLGGAILSTYPDMLSPQLIGRLLSELEKNPNIQKLIQQCDEQGPEQNALVPIYHCMHTPGGPLKYSLEGHLFAVFGFKLTSDSRYIVSVSNKFITWDVSTSDLVREVHPGVEGLMLDLQISPDNRYIAAYTNNSQTILLNALVSEFIVIENPLGGDENVHGIRLLDTNLVIFGQKTWSLLNLSGKVIQTTKIQRDDCILEMQMDSVTDYSITFWSGELDKTAMSLQTFKDDIAGEALDFHSVIVINNNQSHVWVCPSTDSNDIVMYEYTDQCWKVCKTYDTNPYPLLQLKLSTEEHFVIGTFMTGFLLWSTKVETGVLKDTFKKSATVLHLPNGIRNVTKKMNDSSNCVLSAGNKYAISGIRKELYIWDVKSGNLVKELDAHFARIIDIQPLTIGNWNTVITSSIDRTVKVWNINYIFEKVHHIDRHEMPIDSLSLSTEGGIAVTATRSCIGIWEMLSGTLRSRLADSQLGAIVTHVTVNPTGEFIIAAESGNVLFWKVKEEKVLFKQHQKDILQIMTFEDWTKCIVVSRLGSAPNLKATCIVRSFPEGTTAYQFQFPYKYFKKIALTSDGQSFVSYGYEKLKETLFVFHVETGEILHRILPKYPNFKEVSTLNTLFILMKFI